VLWVLTILYPVSATALSVGAPVCVRMTQVHFSDALIPMVESAPVDDGLYATEVALATVLDVLAGLCWYWYTLYPGSLFSVHAAVL
jgi:hypothetical protein